jgi:hypothetical protein
LEIPCSSPEADGMAPGYAYAEAIRGPETPFHERQDMIFFTILA